jgi:hypothetical protein
MGWMTWHPAHPATPLHTNDAVTRVVAAADARTQRKKEKTGSGREKEKARTCRLIIIFAIHTGVCESYIDASRIPNQHLQQNSRAEETYAKPQA